MLLSRLLREQESKFFLDSVDTKTDERWIRPSEEAGAEPTFILGARIERETMNGRGPAGASLKFSESQDLRRRIFRQNAVLNEDDSRIFRNFSEI